MVQEVFLFLVANDGAALRAWDPARGRSLPSFVRLVARHRVLSFLRSGRRSPWTEEPTLLSDMTLEPTPSPESEVGLREEAQRIVEELQKVLTPRGRKLFEEIYLEERSVAEVCARHGLSRDALYAWRTRTRRQVRELGRRLRRSPA